MKVNNPIEIVNKCTHKIIAVCNCKMKCSEKNE